MINATICHAIDLDCFVTEDSLGSPLTKKINACLDTILRSQLKSNFNIFNFFFYTKLNYNLFGLMKLPSYCQTIKIIQASYTPSFDY